MTELKATELVEVREQNPGQYNSPREIILKDKFKWFLTDQFKYLKEEAIKDENILWKEKPPPERGLVLSLYDYTINRNVLLNDSLLGGENSFHQNIIQKPVEIKKNPNLEKPLVQRAPNSKIMTSNGYLIPSATIRETRVSGSQILLLRNPIDFLLQTVHPSVLDNTINIEFVTSKTTRKLLYLEKYPYYYSCYHCYDIHKATFDNLGEYERHIVNGHRPGTVGYPGGPDIEKIELDRVRRKQGRMGWSKLAEMVEANESGKGLFGNKEEAER